MTKNHSNKFMKTNARSISDGEIAASYSRYSNVLQKETSIEDQQRNTDRDAADDGNELPERNKFSDSCISGAIRHRDGLDAMIVAGERGEFQVLYFFSLSRLARESVISLPIIKVLAIKYRIRVISRSEGLDTNNKGWEFQAAILCAHHEQFLRDLSDNVKKGLIGAIEQDFSIGDYCFGYHSIPSPCGKTTRRAGVEIPRKVIVVHEAQAEVVRMVFIMFVLHRWSIRRIARTLTSLNAPKDHRATTPEWRPDLVVSLLRNRKYIGEWDWGKTERVRDPETGIATQRPRDEAEYGEWRRDRSSMRIVEDDLFEAAQTLLDGQSAATQGFRKRKGRIKGSDGSQAQRHTLTGLFKCGGCKSGFQVAGAHGEYLQCSGSLHRGCELKTLLPRGLAAKKLIQTICNQIFKNQEWIRFVHHRTVLAWKESQRQGPASADKLKSLIQERDRQIARLVSEIEESGAPDPALSQRLKERRRERNDFARQLAALERDEGTPSTEPTLDWVTEQLNDLYEVLKATASATGESLLKILGGPISLELMSVEDRKRKYWRGSVNVTSLQLNQLAVELENDEQCLSEIAAPEPIMIEFREPNTTDSQIDKCWELLQTGLSFREMSESLGVNKPRITAIMKQVAKKYGDGLLAKQLKAKFSDQRTPSEECRLFIERVMELYHEDLLLDQIAEQVGKNRNAVSAAIATWHTDRGLPVPDGRTRRKLLQVKERPRKDQRPDQQPPNDDDSIAGKAA